nr:isoform 1 of rho guanine nucleotide exchange factor 7 [Quercus suber]
MTAIPLQLLDVSYLDKIDRDSVANTTSDAGTEPGTETHLCLPSWPEAGQQGQAFECPICYGPVEASTEHSWHFGSSEAFEKHTKQIHQQTFEIGTSQDMLEICGRLNEPQEKQKCVLCDKEYSNFKSLNKHIAHHLEQLTLFALPKDLVVEAPREGVSDKPEAIWKQGVDDLAPEADLTLSSRLLARAICDFEARDENEMSFRKNDLIEVYAISDGWWDGVLGAARGWIPSGYCTELAHADVNHDEAHVSTEATSIAEFPEVVPSSTIVGCTGYSTGSSLTSTSYVDTSASNETS